MLYECFICWLLLILVFFNRTKAEFEQRKKAIENAKTVSQSNTNDDEDSM